MAQKKRPDALNKNSFEISATKQIIKQVVPYGNQTRRAGYAGPIWLNFQSKFGLFQTIQEPGKPGSKGYEGLTL